MKKLLILIVLAAMMLTACQSTTLPTNTGNEHLEATTTEPTAETKKQAAETTETEDPVTETAEETVNAVKEIYKNKLKLKDKTLKAFEEFYPLYDDKNNERIFEAIKALK